MCCQTDLVKMIIQERHTVSYLLAALGPFFGRSHLLVGQGKQGSLAEHCFQSVAGGACAIFLLHLCGDFGCLLHTGSVVKQFL